MKMFLWILAGFLLASASPSRVKPEKILGADVSFLPQLEAEGKHFYDHGVEKDAIQLLKDNGFNYIRLRLFVDPTADSGYSEGLLWPGRHQKDGAPDKGGPPQIFTGFPL